MFLKKYASALSLIALFGCGQQPGAESDVNGHYEEADERLMGAYDGTQRAAAEFEASRGVIIAQNLLSSYRKEQMAQDILSSGIDKLWITVPASFRGNLESPSFNRLRELLGPDMRKVELVKQEVSGAISIWARDWSPLGAKTPEGDLRLLDFNYYTDREADDATARSIISLLPAERVSVPVYNEGGNFMNNSRGLCLMTSRVTDANDAEEVEGDMILSGAQVKGYYQRFAGCAETVIFPRIPYEGTGHIDMWAKFLNNDTVIVGELRDELLPLYSEAHRKKALNMQQFLDKRAAEIEGLGLRVIRVPMPAPDFKEEVFRSYTNSLTVNGLALVPRYLNPTYGASGSPYADAAFRASYEREVTSVYKAAGYRFKWVDSDDMIANGGAVHCTTMQIAR